VRAVAQVTAASRPSDTEILTRVRDLLSQSESRQQRELALRIAQVLRDVDAQRTADLARIQQGMGRIDAMTNADAAAHRELANYLITSTRQQK
jgi:chorismate mutase